MACLQVKRTPWAHTPAVPLGVLRKTRERERGNPRIVFPHTITFTLIPQLTVKFLYLDHWKLPIDSPLDSLPDESSPTSKTGVGRKLQGLG